MLKQSIEGRGNPEGLVALLEKIAPTEKFTLESSLARSRKKFDEHVNTTRRPSLSAKDRDVLPEARLARYRTCIPNYALLRGLTKSTCNAWELGFDKQHKRLIFPVRRHDGKLIGLTGRLLPSAQKLAEATGRALPKYHNYAGLDKGQYIFGEHMLKHKSPVIICEGQIDAILTWQVLGIPTVAPLGEGFSATHARTIASFEPPVVYLFPDNDTAGRMAAEKFEYALHGRMPLKLMMPPIGLDPGGMTSEEIWTALNEAKPILGRISWK
jgi:DNA primase